MMERKPVMLLPSTSVRYGLAVSLTYVYIITFWILGINFVGEVEIYDVSMFPITRKHKILLANIAVHKVLFVNLVQSQDDLSCTVACTANVALTGAGKFTSVWTLKSGKFTSVCTMKSIAL